MKTCLLDVNVSLAISWPHHTHHGVVHQWWRAAGLTKWATSTQTQLGFVRVSCHPKFASPPSTPRHALQLLERMIARADHEFWAEIPGGIADAEIGRRVSASLSHGHVTDAYLAALARYHAGQLATLDRSLVACHPDVAVLVS